MLTCTITIVLQFEDRTNPMDKHLEVMLNSYDLAAAPITPQMFGNAGREHMKKYGEYNCLNKNRQCQLK